MFFYIRYMKGEMKGEEDISFLQQVVGNGIDRDELRDEIYVMCRFYWNSRYCIPLFKFKPYLFIRRHETMYEQPFHRDVWKGKNDVYWSINNSPSINNFDFVSKIWILLGLCIVAFLPSKALLKYLESFIRRNSQQSSISYLPFVDWCGERLRSSRVADRKMVYIFKTCIWLN